jgi:2-dehydro-3-deoxygluconokinase
VAAGLKNDKQDCLAQSEKTSKEILGRFPNCKQVANTFRFEKPDGLDYYATLFMENRLFVSAEHHAIKVIDKVGSGDTFMAGLIYGNYKNLKPQEIIEFSAAAAFNKLFIKGDATTASVEEINAQLKYA